MVGKSLILILNKVGKSLKFRYNKVGKSLMRCSHAKKKSRKIVIRLDAK